MYSNLSNFAKGVDDAFLFILSISIFFLVAITIAMVVFIVRYNRKKNPVATQIHGSNILEIVWTVIPIILVLFMFYFGWKGYHPMKEQAPKNSLTIKTTARMWSWAFQYPNGKITDSLYIPVGKPVRLELNSTDVIHSLYIPSFRVKQDVVPGRHEIMWFIPEKEGRYDIFCTEYCGLQHSYMISAVNVLNDTTFNKWYKDTTEVAATKTAGAAPGAKGLAILKKNGCLACHSLDGSKIVGPSYKGLYGRTETVVTNGSERQVKSDDAYIHKSIYEPNADVVKGYNAGMMISYKSTVSEEDIKQIIEYFKTLK
jgi:cytochrome c oxidase subunit II